MTRIRWTPGAAADLQAIRDFIARDLARTSAPRGLVLNAVGRQHTGYYYGSGYYYYHSSYGRDDAGEKAGEKRAAS